MFRIDNAENEKELRELKKVLDDIKGRMKKLDKATIERFSGVIKVFKRTSYFKFQRFSEN